MAVVTADKRQRKIELQSNSVDTSREGLNILCRYKGKCLSQWPCGLKVRVCGHSLAGVAGSNPARGGGPWISLSFVFSVLSGNGLCVGLVTRPEESYRMWCV